MDTIDEAPNKFKRGTQRLLKGLFYEMTQPDDRQNVLYTLKDRDHKGYKSLYTLYIAEGDPWEHTFAEKYFDGWDHWEDLCNCRWFKPYIDRWRNELEVKIRSQALRAIREEAEAATPQSYQANKFLLEKGWVTRKEPTQEERRNKRGRPSKEEILKSADELARSFNQISEDADRLGLN
jgi:hypothetical protein